MTRTLLVIIALLLAGMFALQLQEATTPEPRPRQPRERPCYYGSSNCPNDGVIPLRP